jgi:ADP-dependent phosphofructokinase/glucokinase
MTFVGCSTSTINTLVQIINSQFSFFVWVGWEKPEILNLMKRKCKSKNHRRDDDKSLLKLYFHYKTRTRYVEDRNEIKNDIKNEFLSKKKMCKGKVYMRNKILTRLETFFFLVRWSLSLSLSPIPPQHSSLLAH